MALILTKCCLFEMAWHFFTFRCSMTVSLIHHRGKNHMLKYSDIWRWRLDKTCLSDTDNKFARLWVTVIFRDKRHTSSRQGVAALLQACSVLISTKQQQQQQQQLRGSYRGAPTSPDPWTEFDFGQIKHSERSPLGLFEQLPVVPC